MPFFSRKSRRNKKTVSKRTTAPVRREEPEFANENQGYNPYDTLPGRPRDEFGMHRNDDGKWTF